MRRWTAWHIAPVHPNKIVHGKRRVTADTAMRLARYFGETGHFPTQTRVDLEVEKDPR